MKETAPQHNDESVTHVESLQSEQVKVKESFDDLVRHFLEKAPNCKIPNQYTRLTLYNNEYPTIKAAKFTVGKSRVVVDYIVDHGTPPKSTLTIGTPIIIDNLDRDIMDSFYPPQPFERVEFISSEWGLTLEVGAYSRPGDFGRPIIVEEYTTGGLLPAMQTQGRGKLEAFGNLVGLLDGFNPEEIEYAQPPAPIAASR